MGAGKGSRLRGMTGRYLPFLFLTVLLLWPLLLNRHPFYVSDSASYLRGGELGFGTALLMLDEWWRGLFGSGAAADAGTQGTVSAAVGQAGGMRSLTYSLITYFFRMPGHSLFALVVFQAGAVAFLVLVAKRLMAPRANRWEVLALILCLAFLTPAGWGAATAMPDIFAGVAVLGSILLTLFLERLGHWERIALVLLLALSISVHGSHLPLALGTLAAGAAARFVLRRPGWAQTFRDGLWFLSAPLLGLSAMLTLSYVGFGTASLAPKRYPILLARSVADGPGRLYLEAHCARDRYAICEVFGTDFPTQPRKFLWEKDGVRYRATPEQMERIRKEEGPIVRAAAAEYPMLQLRSSTGNVLRQFVSFGLGTVDFRSVLGAGPTGRVELVEVTEDRPHLRFWVSVVIYIAFGSSLVVFFLLRSRMSRQEWAMLLVAFVGLAGNAVICGILSGVSDRYQARVAWIIPLLAILMLLRWRNDRANQMSFPEDQSPPPLPVNLAP